MTWSAYSSRGVYPLSTRARAARSGWLAHISADFKMARKARLVAIGFFLTNSRLAVTRQQKYWDHGRSVALLTTTWPIFLARNSWAFGGKPRNAYTFPSVSNRTDSIAGWIDHLMSFRGSKPT